MTAGSYTEGSAFLFVGQWLDYKKSDSRKDYHFKLNF